MSAPEINEIKAKMAELDRKLDDLKDNIEQHNMGFKQTLSVILTSLRRCQSRCHVDNPPGKWRALGRAIAALFNKQPPLMMETNDAK